MILWLIWKFRTCVVCSTPEYHISALLYQPFVSQTVSARFGRCFGCAAGSGPAEDIVRGLGVLGGALHLGCDGARPLLARCGPDEAAPRDSGSCSHAHGAVLHVLGFHLDPLNSAGGHFLYHGCGAGHGDGYWNDHTVQGHVGSAVQEQQQEQVQGLAPTDCHPCGPTGPQVVAVPSPPRASHATETPPYHDRRL